MLATMAVASLTAIVVDILLHIWDKKRTQLKMKKFIKEWSKDSENYRNEYK